MNALSQEARALIESVSTLDDPTRADKLRVRTRLVAELGAAALATVVVSSAGASLASSSAADAAVELGGASAGASTGAGWSFVSKLLLSGAALAGVLAGSLWLSRGPNESAQQRAQVDARAQDTAAQSVASPPAPNAQEGEQVRADQASAQEAKAEANARAAAPQAVSRIAKSEERRPAHVQKAPANAAAAVEAPGASGTLGLELKLLGEAQAALRAGAPQRALVLTAEHRASFPEGVMKEERLGIEALAGCALGRDYRAQAEAFLRVAKSSPLIARVQKACGIKP